MSFAAPLAQWTNLSPVTIEGIYKARRLDGPAAQWPELVERHRDRHEELILAACKEAEAHHFFRSFARSVIRIEEEVGRDPEDTRRLVRENPGILGVGMAQALMNHDRGLMNARILPKIVQATQACARVTRTYPDLQPLGTAFLVKPNIVMTAAHVVLDRDTATLKWGGELIPDLLFEFEREEPENEGDPLSPPATQKVKVAPKPGGALLSFAQPHASASATMELNLSCDPPANENLDFALIELERPMHEFPEVPIDERATLEVGQVCWAFGFPGWSDLVFDMDDIIENHLQSGRWRHRANTVNGMSGGICINQFGKLVGIHEGGVVVSPDGTRSRDDYNRGVTIKAIRNRQRATGNDPLIERSMGPPAEFENSELVKQLYQAGLTLARRDYQAGWKRAVIDILGTIPDGTEKIAEFHPWFHRNDFEDWIDDTAKHKKLAFVIGERGTGKSFCGEILRQKLDYQAFDLLALNPTQTQVIDWKDTLANAIDPRDADYRMAAASMRYSGADAVVQDLAQRAERSQRTRYVVLDFGHMSDGERFDGSPWFDLVSSLLMNDWVRVVLIGLNEDERNALIQHLRFQSATRQIRPVECEMSHIDRNDFIGFALDLAVSRGWGAEQPLVTAEVDRVFNDLTATDNAALQTCWSALMGIQMGVSDGW